MCRSIAFHIKLSLEQKLCVLDSIKSMDLLEFLMELDIYHCLTLKKYDAIYDRVRYLTWFDSEKMMLFTTELDILSV